MVHNGMSSSYRSVDCIGLWSCLVELSVFQVPLCLRASWCYVLFCLHPCVYLLVNWAWWDWPLTWLTNHHPSVLWHCWLGHVTRKIVPEMTYNQGRIQESALGGPSPSLFPLRCPCPSPFLPPLPSLPSPLLCCPLPSCPLHPHQKQYISAWCFGGIFSGCRGGSKTNIVHCQQLGLYSKYYTVCDFTLHWSHSKCPEVKTAKPLLSVLRTGKPNWCGM